jgi:hypothetical protein
MACLLAHAQIASAADRVKKLSVEQLDAQFERNAAEYLDGLPGVARTRILGAFAKIHRAPRELVQLTVSNARLPTILFVQGFDFRPLPFEWVEAFDETFKTRASVYFFKWSRLRPFADNVDLLRQSILELVSTPEISDLKIVAYSAGGVLAVVSIGDIADPALSNRVSLVTVASPFYGYRMPAITVLGIPFVGGTTVQLGRGIQHLKRKVRTLANLKYCVNWVTTNCELDKNACLQGNDLYPQLGVAHDHTVLPCGAGNMMTASSDETHYTALVTIVSRIVGELHETSASNP